jgi:hypothetical protein
MYITVQASGSFDIAWRLEVGAWCEQIYRKGTKDAKNAKEFNLFLASFVSFAPWR